MRYEVCWRVYRARSIEESACLSPTTSFTFASIRFPGRMSPLTLGVEFNLVNHFLAVSLLDEKSLAIVVSYFPFFHGADVLPHSCFTLLDGRCFAGKR